MTSEAPPLQWDPGALLGSYLVAGNPQKAYAMLREQCPVARTTIPGTDLVYVSRYDDVLWALLHPEYFSSEVDHSLLGEHPLIPLQIDPPRHTTYRKLLNPEFLPRAVEQLEPALRSLVREVIGPLVSRGQCDFHAEVATPLPSSFFLAYMGLPLSDLPIFLRWRDNSIRPDAENPDPANAAAIRRHTAREISEYFRRAIAERRERPDDGLLSRIVHKTIDGERLSEGELLGISHFFLLAGLDTVTASLDCLVTHLAMHPGRRQQLVERPELLSHAIEDLLRWETPVMVVPRTVKQAVRLSDVSLAPGDRVVLALGAANGDESEFGGGDVDFTRVPNRHVAFGAGHHYCLGAHLARLELRVTLQEFHRLIPNYRIAPRARIRFSPAVRQAEKLPLEWDVTGYRGTRSTTPTATLHGAPVRYR